MNDRDGSEQQAAYSRARLIGFVALIIVASAMWAIYSLKGA